MIANLNTRLNCLERAPISGRKVFEVLVSRNFENAKAMQLHRERIRKEHGDQVFFVNVTLAGSDGSTGYKCAT